MTGRQAMWLILALALASASGIITMLFTDGPWDAVCLGLTALPLAVGGAASPCGKPPPARVCSE